MHLVAFDLRAGLPINTDIDTSSISEIRFVKECWKGQDLTKKKNSLWVVDRGFIDADYWDSRKRTYGGMVPLLNGLSNELLERLSTRAKAMTFLPGDQIIGEGEKGDSLYIIAFVSNLGPYLDP